MNGGLVMKKVISAVLLLTFILALTGCNSQNDKTDNTTIESTGLDLTEASDSNVTEVNAIDDEGRLYKLENSVLYGKGNNFEGIFGEKDYYDSWVKIAENVKKFDAMSAVLIYLTMDGKVYGLGSKDGGVLQERTNPEFLGEETADKPVFLFDDCKDISLGCRFVLAQKNDDSVWFWGESLNGQSKQIVDQIITPIELVSKAKKFKAILYTSAWIDENNTLYMCGDNSYGHIGNGRKGTGFPTLYEDIVQTPYPVLENCANVYCSEDKYYVYAETVGGSTYVWGGGEYTTPTNIKNIHDNQ